MAGCSNAAKVVRIDDCKGGESIMFEPGHLHVMNMQGLDTQAVDIHLRYDICKDETGQSFVHFDMEGEIDGESFKECFELPRDAFYNFASNAKNIAEAHGLHVRFWPIVDLHQDYDAMFEDIRQRLDVQPGEPIDLEKFD